VKKIIIAILAILLIVGIATPSIIQYNALGSELYSDITENRDHYFCTVGIGSSMEPAIHEGDLLVVQLYTHPDFSVDVGDVVVYSAPMYPTYPYAEYLRERALVAHRVVSKATVAGQTRYMIRGDAVPQADPWSIYDECIVGKVVKVIPRENKMSIYMVSKMLERDHVSLPNHWG